MLFSGGKGPYHDLVVDTEFTVAFLEFLLL